MGKCIVCDEMKEYGIHLHMRFICSSCEHNIIHTDAREDKYHYYIQKLKNINPTAYM